MSGDKTHELKNRFWTALADSPFLFLQLDSAPHPSVFDRVVAYDGGADEVMSYGGVTEGAVRDLVHGAIFTRGPKHLHNTARPKGSGGRFRFLGCFT